MQAISEKKNLIKRTKLEKSRNSYVESELPLPGEASGIGAHVLQSNRCVTCLAQ